MLLPEAIALNAPAAEDELTEVARVCGLAARSDALGDALRVLQQRLRVPTRLRDLGVRREQLSTVADLVMHERGLYFNPRRVTHASEIGQLLDRVW